MGNTPYDDVTKYDRDLHLDFGGELAKLVTKYNFPPDALKAIGQMSKYLDAKKDDTVINTLFHIIRIPLKAPKTFQNYDFSRIHGQDVYALKVLSAPAKFTLGQTSHLSGRPAWERHIWRRRTDGHAVNME